MPGNTIPDRGGERLGPSYPTLAEIPLVFVDVETTGLDLARDRIVELAAIRVEPGGAETVLETLIHPGGPVAATHIHGIEDVDLVEAPSFRNVAGRLLELTDGAALVAHNAEFDMGHLQSELRKRPAARCSRRDSAGPKTTHDDAGRSS